MTRVIVVDDEPITREITTAVLESAGYQVVTTPDASTALHDASGADLVVTDLLMPGIDGYELARSLHDRPGTSATPVVFYSANYNQDQVRPLAEACGVDHIVSRAAPPQVLLDAVADALGADVPPMPAAEEFHRRHSDIINARLLSSITELDDKQIDLTRARERERELVAEQAAALVRQQHDRIDSLSRMARQVAHEFNNIFASVDGFLSFAREGVENGGAADEVLEDLERCRQGLARAARISNRLLTFGRHEIARAQDVGLGTLLRNAEPRLRADLPPGVTLTLTATEDPLTVRVDPDQIVAAVQHLVTNAAESMPGGGVCRVTVRTDHDQARIDVTDTGRGMNADTLDRAVEPFFSTKPAASGTGLGLTEAHGTVTQAGGRLALRSEASLGTTASILLPLPAAPPAAPPPPADPGAGGQATVLIVDDDEDVRYILVRYCTAAGYRILTAANGREALAVAEQDGAVDCLLTDVQMPVMDGRELAATFAERWPTVPVVFVSGYAGALLAGNRLIDPDVTVVKKPFTRDTVLAALTAALPRTAR